MTDNVVTLRRRIERLEQASHINRDAENEPWFEAELELGRATEALAIAIAGPALSHTELSEETRAFRKAQGCSQVTTGCCGKCAENREERLDRAIGWKLGTWRRIEKLARAKGAKDILDDHAKHSEARRMKNEARARLLKRAHALPGNDGGVRAAARLLESAIRTAEANPHPVHLSMMNDVEHWVSEGQPVEAFDGIAALAVPFLTALPSTDRDESAC